MNEPRQSEITVLKVDVGIIKAQMVDMRQQNDRIENKLNNMTFASVTDVAAAKAELVSFKQEVKETYVTKEAFDPLKKTFWQVASIITGVLALALLGLIVKK